MNDEPHFVIPASALRSLLFKESGDIDHPKIAAPLSQLPGDLAKIIITHWEIGAYIAKIDPNENYFHVELVPNDIKAPKKSHAEIWLSFEWRESNSRREKIKAYHKELREKRDERELLIIELADELSALKLPEHFCRLIAETVADNTDKNLSSLAESLGITEALKQYEKKKANRTNAEQEEQPIDEAEKE